MKLIFLGISPKQIYTEKGEDLPLGPTFQKLVSHFDKCVVCTIRSLQYMQNSEIFVWLLCFGFHSYAQEMKPRAEAGQNQDTRRLHSSLLVQLR